ncbi:hypothetical protein ACWDPV_04070 [Gordonia sp. NPDC003504]
MNVDECARAFVDGIAGRARRIDVPSWVSVFRWLRPVFSSRLLDKQADGLAARFADRADAEVAELHRWGSSRIVSESEPS